MQAHLDRHLGIDPVISPVELRVHTAGSLAAQEVWLRPHLLQGMRLWVAGEVFHGEDRCVSDDEADNAKASRWHMCQAQKASTCARLALNPLMLLSAQTCRCPVEYINTLLI